MRKFFGVFVLILAITMFAELSPFAQFETYIGADATGQYGGVLVVPTLSGPRTCNDVVAQETSSRDVIVRFMASMIELDNYARIHPALAESWELKQNEDGSMEIIWHLRKGVKWSDGTPFTADDVVFTINDVYFNPDIPNDMQDLFADNWPVAEKIDDYTVKTTLKETYRLAVRYIGGIPIFPKHLAEPYVKEGKFKEFWTVDAINKGEIVGLGPFIPVEYVPDQYVRFERNPYYWKYDKDGKQLPYLDGIIFKIIPTQDAQRLAFENGEVDVYGPRGTEYAELKAMAQEKGWVVGVGGPNFGTTFITFNWNAPDPVKRKWFRNDFFRRAVAYAIDKQSMIDTLYNGLAVEQWGPISQAATVYYDESVLRKYPYNLDLARTMLKLGGFKWDENGQLLDSEGNPVKFIIMTNAGNQVREGMGNIITESLKKLGMDVTFAPIDFNTLVQKLVVNGDWEAVIIGLTGSDEPQGGANVWRIKGSLHFWNYHPEVKEFVDPNDYYSPDWEKEIDRIFEENVKILDQQKVVDMFREFQRLVSEHLPLIYTTQQLYLYAYSKKLHNLEPTAFGGMWGWNQDCVWKEQ
ncbi:ABC transporter substrate-binding protein [Thermotoga sp. SG1]|uniref:ABC transporter substrate-binding protein n=1 Tax=Thermotoga sp. SG1 TaxID=126739 RepID=UPI000C75ACC5|nr:ABC transporter substrate-binding protein [Thermotoga sp. SG1]PLV56663.1 peptide ABC transporter substrate-binding protein [Thermotoga sp. SG1]